MKFNICQHWRLLIKSQFQLFNFNFCLDHDSALSEISLFPTKFAQWFSKICNPNKKSRFSWTRQPMSKLDPFHSTSLVVKFNRLFLSIPKHATRKARKRAAAAAAEAALFCRVLGWPQNWRWKNPFLSLLKRHLGATKNTRLNSGQIFWLLVERRLQEWLVLKDTNCT